MDENDKPVVASNLTIAFYAGQESRPSYLGEERRTSNAGKDQLRRDLRSPSLTPKEVFVVYLRFLAMLDSPDSGTSEVNKVESD